MVTWKPGDEGHLIQRRSCAGFLDKALLAVGISYALRGQNFECHGAAELGVLGLVHHTHTAPA